MTAPDATGIEAALAAGLAAHQMVATAYYQRTHQWDASCRAGDWSECGEMGGRDAAEAAHRAHVAAALLPVVTQAQAEAKVEALRLVRQVEAEMSEQAADAWRSADARRGLSDHEALLVHADALTRWSERFRMAFDGEDYRARADESGGA